MCNHHRHDHKVSKASLIAAPCMVLVCASLAIAALKRKEVATLSGGGYSNLLSHEICSFSECIPNTHVSHRLADEYQSTMSSDL